MTTEPACRAVHDISAIRAMSQGSCFVHVSGAMRVGRLLATAMNPFSDPACILRQGSGANR